MRRRGALRNWLEYLPARALVAAVERLPEALAWPLARMAARLLHLAIPRWRRIARRNLLIAFPDLSEAERERIRRGAVDHVGRVLLEFARLPRLTPANVAARIVYDGFEHFERPQCEGRGVIFLTAHLGAWELSAAAHALYGHPMVVMVRPLDNPLLDRFVAGRRAMHGNRSLAKRDAARDVLRALRAGQAVGILADQNAAGDDGVFVDVFGVPASATRGVAAFAERAGAAIVPGFAFWNAAAGCYVLKFYEPVPPETRFDREANLLETTRRCQAAIESAIRERPEQWLWIHRRWKRRPPGEPDLYGGSAELGRARASGYTERCENRPADGRER